MIRERLWNWISAGQKVTEARSLDRLEFADMECAFLAENTIGLTSANALAVRVPSDKPGPAYFWKALPEATVSRFLRQWLLDQGISHLWSVYAVEQFREYMRAGASPVPPNEKFYA